MLCVRTLQQDVPTVGVEPAAVVLQSCTCPALHLQGHGEVLSASQIERMMNLVPFMDTSIDRSLVHHQSLYTHILTRRAL